MSNFQLCSLEEFLDNDDEMISPDEFMASMQPHIEEPVHIPEEHIYENAVLDKSTKMVEGEITQMLRLAPGILPPVDCFPKSYKPPKPSAKQPDFIPSDRYNKIPILLADKYFKFHGNDDDAHDEEIETVNQSVRAIVNNLDGSGSSSNSSNRKQPARNARSSQKSASGSNDDFEERFRNVFINDASDEDNCKVCSSPDSTTHENPMPQPPAKPVQQQQYFNARQLYELKRGKKQ